MLEENGIVIAVEHNEADKEPVVWVQTQIKTTCGQCQAKDSCASGAVAKAFSPKASVLPVSGNLEVKVGDSVVIAIEEQFVVRSALYVYILPIAGFMAFAGLGPVLLSGNGLLTLPQPVADLIQAGFAFFGGWLGFLLARRRLAPGTGDRHCRHSERVRLLAVNRQQIPITFDVE